MTRFRVIALALVIAVTPTQVAMALPVLWTVDLFNPGGNQVITGSFVYDADVNVFTDINVSATDDVGLSNTTYTVTSSVLPSTASRFIFLNSSAVNLTDARGVSMELPCNCDQADSRYRRTFGSETARPSQRCLVAV